MVWSVKDLNQFENVRVIQFLEDGDLTLEEQPVLWLDIFGFDDLYGKPSLLVVVADAFIDGSSIATANDIFKVVAVLSNSFFEMMSVDDFILFVTFF